ncbi:MAG: FAD-binding oxidoreductase [Deltaproteobacteria bacterium]|nr:FAD-binding oxidoreductase [Deltaproteobacteria bacterium]
MTGVAWDVVVVGAGSAGLPSALALAERGMRVLVLEELTAPGQGQHKAAIGGVRATHSDPAKILLCRDSLRIFGSWRETNGDDIGWKMGGYCFPVYTDAIERTLRGILPAQKAAGLEIDWVGPEEIARLVPGIAREGLRGGTFSPGDGQVSPLLFAISCERAAKRRGVEFRYGEAVVGFETAGGGVTAVRTTKETYATGHVVLAAGAHARPVGRMLGLEIPVVPDAHEGGITAPVEQFLGPLVVDLRPGPEGKTANFYFGQNAEGQIIFCYTPKPLFVGEDRESTSEFLPILARRMVSLIPRLRHLLVRRVWRGLYPMTPDGVIIVDRVREVGGVTLAVGMCGQGFMLGPGVGRLVAALIAGEPPTISAEAFSAISFYRSFGAAKTEALK